MKKTVVPRMMWWRSRWTPWCKKANNWLRKFRLIVKGVNTENIILDEQSKSHQVIQQLEMKLLDGDLKNKHNVTLAVNKAFSWEHSALELKVEELQNSLKGETLWSWFIIPWRCRENSYVSRLASLIKHHKLNKTWTTTKLRNNIYANVVEIT